MRKTLKHLYKYLFPLLLLIVLYPEAQASASSCKDSVTKFSLDMKWRILYGKKGLAGASITVYLDSSRTIVRNVESDEKGWATYRMPIQKFYTITIAKKGFVTKIITVDAKMPKSFQTSDYFFELSVDLFEEIATLDVSMLKKPVAKIFFNTFNKNFDYDFNYTVKILGDLKKLYDDHKLLSKQPGRATPDSSQNKK